MANLKIEYLPDTRLVLFAANVSDVGWLNIRRLCQEITDEFLDNGPLQFTIPCWSFLAIRKSIGHYARSYSLGLELDPHIESLLQNAVKRDKSFQQPADLIYKEEQIQDELFKLSFGRRLTNEQRRNVCRLISFPASATFSVPGAGKTTEALAYFTLRSTSETHLLVITPKNAFAAWEEQLKECLPHFAKDITRLTGGVSAISKQLKDATKFLLITYQQTPTVIDQLGTFLSSTPCMIFLDESHRMKRGIEGVIGKAILSLAHLPTDKLIMSGTPLPNSIDDLVPQFGFLYPEINANTDNVIDYVNKISVRTTKKELGLPPVMRFQTPIELTPSQRYLYTLLKSEIAREAANLRLKDRMFLRRFSRSVLRLLQLVSNPMLLSKDKISHEGLLAEILAEEDSPKISYVCNRARQLANQGKKVLIWSAFVDNVELLAERLFDLGADYIHGGVEAGSEEDDQTREAKIRRFHDDKHAMVLVANPAACSEGISLHTVCHHAIYLDRNFNAAQYLQSEDRIHRLGLSQEQDTTIEIIYCPNTVDEVVDHRLRTKFKLMEDVLNDPGLKYDPIVLDPEATDLDTDDINEILAHLKETA